MTRKLVTLRTINELRQIEGADRIELAIVDGWQCVVKKGEFSIGDKGLFFEIDSIVPSNDPRFSFLEPKFRVKTIRLRGQLSQGLMMPLSKFPEVYLQASDEDLATQLGVQKYEPPVPMGGQQKGTFPTHLVPKTDQERVQNLKHEIAGRRFVEFEITEKLDGTSCTIWHHNGYVGVASRNWEMSKDGESVYNAMLSKYGLEARLASLGRNIAIQGEIIGHGIQGNKYNLSSQQFFVFDIYDIDKKQYLGYSERRTLIKALGLQRVPGVTPNEVHHRTELEVDTLLRVAEGKSRLADVEREGLVFKSYDGSFSFKAISNEWLLKYE